MTDIIVMVAVPVMLCLAAAAVLGRVLKRHFTALPSIMRISVAMLAPIALVVFYFWVWQQIDFAQHQAAGGGDYMGPMTALIYGAPIYGVAFVAGAILAAYFYAKS